MTASPETAVLIVGARLTGLTLAIALARQGVSCRIVEQLDQYPVASRAKGFSPRTLEVFEDLGVLSDVLADGRDDVPWIHYDRSRIGMDFWTRRARRPRPGTPYPYLLQISTPLVERALRKRLAALGVEVELGRTFVDLEQSGEEVVARMRDSDGADAEPIRAQYLVGCDGGRSTVRKALGLRLDLTTAPGVAHFAGDVELDGLDRSHGRIWFLGDGYVLALTPLPSTSSWQFQFRFPYDERDGLPEPTLEAFQRIVDERCPKPGVRLSNATWTSVWRESKGVVDRFRVGRAFVAGDAAHIHSPAGGLGANTGIQDAYNLGWKLGLVVRGKASPRLLDTYHEERHAVAQQLMEANRKASKVQSPSGSRWNAFVRRNIFFPLTNAYGVVDALLRFVDQMKITYRGASLSQHVGPASRRRLAAGDRAPDARMPDAATGEQVRLFELFAGSHFTLLGFGSEHLAVLERVARDYDGQLRSCLVVPPDGGDPKAQVQTLVDARGQVARRFGIESSGLVLVRPDGYVGFSAGSGAQARLRLYLVNTLGLLAVAPPDDATAAVPPVAAG